MKYEIGDGFLLGSDICPEVLLKVHKCPLSDIHLADALHLPYRYAFLYKYALPFKLSMSIKVNRLRHWSVACRLIPMERKKKDSDNSNKIEVSLIYVFNVRCFL